MENSSENRIREFFDRDYYLGFAPLLKDKTSKEVAFLKQVIGSGRNRRILDLCCGYGRHMKELIRVVFG